MTWHQFSFRLRAAPELYGSPELGVLFLLYWRLSGGTHTQKKEDVVCISGGPKFKDTVRCAALGVEVPGYR